MTSYFYIGTTDGITMWLPEVTYSHAEEVCKLLERQGREVSHFQAVTR